MWWVLGWIFRRFLGAILLFAGGMILMMAGFITLILAVATGDTDRLLIAALLGIVGLMISFWIVPRVVLRAELIRLLMSMRTMRTARPPRG